MWLSLNKFKLLLPSSIFPFLELIDSYPVQSLLLWCLNRSMWSTSSGTLRVLFLTSPQKENFSKSPQKKKKKSSFLSQMQPMWMKAKSPSLCSAFMLPPPPPTTTYEQPLWYKYATPFFTQLLYYCFCPSNMYLAKSSGAILKSKLDKTPSKVTHFIIVAYFFA